MFIFEKTSDKQMNYQQMLHRQAPAQCLLHSLPWKPTVVALSCSVLGSFFTFLCQQCPISLFIIYLFVRKFPAFTLSPGDSAGSAIRPPTAREVLSLKPGAPTGSSTGTSLKATPWDTGRASLSHSGRIITSRRPITSGGGREAESEVLQSGARA